MTAPVPTFVNCAGIVVLVNVAAMPAAFWNCGGHRAVVVVASVGCATSLLVDTVGAAVAAGGWVLVVVQIADVDVATAEFSALKVQPAECVDRLLVRTEYMWHTCHAGLGCGLYANATQPCFWRQRMAHAAASAVSFCCVEPSRAALLLVIVSTDVAKLPRGPAAHTASLVAVVWAAVVGASAGVWVLVVVQIAEVDVATAEFSALKVQPVECVDGLVVRAEYMWHTCHAGLGCGLYANATQPCFWRQRMAHAAASAVSFCCVEPSRAALLLVIVSTDVAKLPRGPAAHTASLVAVVWAAVVGASVAGACVVVGAAVVGVSVAGAAVLGTPVACWAVVGTFVVADAAGVAMLVLVLVLVVVVVVAVGVAVAAVVAFLMGVVLTSGVVLWMEVVGDAVLLARQPPVGQGGKRRILSFVLRHSSWCSSC